MENNQKKDHRPQGEFGNWEATPTNLERLRSRLAPNPVNVGHESKPIDEWRELKDKIDQGQAFPWFLRQQ
uniref:Uncharacterized protein n=1 Tax=Candidatus Kentrum sp. SD TaxID=2126332 RepID=A0A450YUY2_9GAMM|nr:MAG: hypothetical protein BECKSD772F_GA0070984_10506 [Candidatus Kentron sp. SD]VFK45357.1 MAG: hypothetical protein BECKSD772E_GA0070983_10525 [Candidatus Kentron sp. SD]VFK79527.1 MAG: hypothetical protein BECKSD772D_GA0070982_10537 [Candidatus Kentron sp. SD]